MKDVRLQVRSTQEGVETSYICTVASMKMRNGVYKFVFDSPRVGIFDVDKLCLIASERGLRVRPEGVSKIAEMILETGKKHYRHFRRRDGSSRVVGIETYRVMFDLTKDGGEFEVEFMTDDGKFNYNRNLVELRFVLNT